MNMPMPSPSCQTFSVIAGAARLDIHVNGEGIAVDIWSRDDDAAMSVTGTWATWDEIDATIPLHTEEVDDVRY